MKDQVLPPTPKPQVIDYPDFCKTHLPTFGKIISIFTDKSHKHPSCRGSGEDCGYETTISCDDCKYGGCRGLRSGKDPEAKCNQPKEVL